MPWSIKSEPSTSGGGSSVSAGSCNFALQKALPESSPPTIASCNSTSSWAPGCTNSFCSAGQGVCSAAPIAPTFASSHWASCPSLLVYLSSCAKRFIELVDQRRQG